MSDTAPEPNLKETIRAMDTRLKLMEEKQASHIGQTAELIDLFKTLKTIVYICTVIGKIAMWVSAVLGMMIVGKSFYEAFKDMHIIGK